MSLVLYHSPGACSRVPLILLERAGVDFELRIVRLQAGEHRAEGFQRLNPKGKVPVLARGDAVLTENVAIAAWIAAAYPQARLLPAADDAWAHAQALSWLAWGATTLHPLMFRLRMAQRVAEGAQAQDSVRALALADYRQQFQVAEQRLAERAWLVGDDWMAPDAYLFWCTSRAPEMAIDLAAFPRLAAHAERLRQDPVVQRALAREAAAVAALPPAVPAH